MGWRERVRRANAARAFHVHAALGIGASLELIVLAQTLLLGWRDWRQIVGLTILYGLCGFAGTLAGSWTAAWLTDRAPRATAAWAMLVGGLAMGLGALGFALLYRSAYSQWHDPAFTVGWAVQSVFTMAGAIYYWAVLGTRLILPWAIVPLVIGALAFARRPR